MPDFITQKYSPLYRPQSSNVKEVRRNVNQPAVRPEIPPGQKDGKQKVKDKTVCALHL